MIYTQTVQRAEASIGGWGRGTSGVGRHGGYRTDACGRSPFAPPAFLHTQSSTTPHDSSRRSRSSPMFVQRKLAWMKGRSGVFAIEWRLRM